MSTFRVVVAFFSIAGLDTLDKLNAITEEKKKEIINSLYSFQVLNDRGNIIVNKFSKLY